MKIFTDFGIFAREGLSGSALCAARCELHNIDRALIHYDRHIDEALKHPKLSSATKRFLESLWYGDPRDTALSLANRKVRRAGMLAAITVLLAHAQGDPKARERRLRFRLMTTAPNLGITKFEAPILNLKSVARHWYFAARKAGVHGLAFIDLSLIDQRMDLQPLKLGLHVHSAVRAIDNSFRPRRAVLIASPVVARNKCGIKVVNISSRGRDWRRGLAWADLAKIGYYISKITCGIDVVFTKAKRRQTKTTQHGWTLVQALRQLECYSHCDALETTSAIGAGVQLRSAWKRMVLRQLKFATKARGIKIDHARLERQWTRLWRELGCDLRPVQVA